MSYNDSDNEKSYSWVNILLIFLCLAMLGYGVMYFKSPETHHKFMQYLGLEENVTAIQNKAIVEEANVVSDELADLAMQENAASAEASLAEETATEVEPDPDLPPLNTSDDYVVNKIKDIGDEESIDQKIIPNFFIYNSVVFITNFSNGQLLTNFSPLAPPATAFAVEKEDGNLYMSSSTYQRYDDYSNFIASLNTEKTVATYNKLKPLINESYQEIAHPGAEFDDALNNAIDLALAVPLIDEKIKLSSPSVMYTYQNETWQDLNDAQKFLLRFGPTNLAKIQNKLRDIRTQLNTVKTNVEADQSVETEQAVEE